MTGTSIDGIDAALVRIEGGELMTRATLVRHISQSLGDIGPRLRAAADQQPMTAGDFARLAWEFGELHARVIGELASHSGVDLICVHGQTVFHQPPISWQLVNPAPIARRFACPVVSGLRQADLAAGGQGAPITPIADWILFRDAHKRRAIVNLGGFCNVTILPAQEALNEIRGFDVCACNQILDAVARRALSQPFDEGGAAASRGRATPQAVEALRALLERQRAAKRSLGTGDEAAHWVNNQLQVGLKPQDIAASAVHTIAMCIGDSLKAHDVDEIVLAGGGTRNIALVNEIARASDSAVVTSDALDVPIEAREAMAFAILGALCADGVAITLPQVTGCREPGPVAGVWTNAHLLHESRGCSGTRGLGLPSRG